MPILHAIVLGIVQGLSEFLPISSSGHLVLVPWFFGWEELTSRPQLNRAFDVALHVGTFAGALAYFQADIVRLVRHDRRLGGLLLVSAVPAALTGVALDRYVAQDFDAVWFVGAMLIVFGLVLAWADRLPGKLGEGDFGPRAAVLMGAAQALALQPGVSRSGATISMARHLGFERDAATRLSFLMSLPIIGGAGAYQALDVFVLGDGVPAGFAGAFVWGTIASAVTGFLAVWGLLRFVRTRSFRPFVVYRVLLGLLVLALAPFLGQ